MSLQATVAGSGISSPESKIGAVTGLILAITGLLTVLENHLSRRERRTREQRMQQWAGPAVPAPAPTPPNETDAPARPDWYLSKEPVRNTWPAPAPASTPHPVRTRTQAPNRWWVTAAAAGSPIDGSAGGTRV